MRELNGRQDDDMDIRLLWCEADASVLVAVNDHQTGEAFSVEVQDGERALQVCNHPYVHVALQRTRCDRRGVIDPRIDRAAEHCGARIAELRRG